VVGESKPDPAVQAFAEVGIKTWPPVPARSAAWGAGAAVGEAADGPPDAAAETHSV
jgi:hypothetical protein